MDTPADTTISAESRASRREQQSMFEYYASEIIGFVIENPYA